MKRALVLVCIPVLAGLLFGAVALNAVAEPYVEYKLSGFTSYQTPTVNTIAVGVETPAVFGALTFDVALVCDFQTFHDALLSFIAGRFGFKYGNSDTFFKGGCLISSDVGFSPYFDFKLSLPVFTLWGVP